MRASLCRALALGLAALTCSAVVHGQCELDSGSLEQMIAECAKPNDVVCRSSPQPPQTPGSPVLSGACGNPCDQLPDSDALQACVDALSPGGGIIRLINTCGNVRPLPVPPPPYNGYLLDKTVVLRSKVKLTSGSSTRRAKLVAYAGSGQALEHPMLAVAPGSSDFQITDLVLDGNKSQRNAGICTGAGNPPQRMEGISLKVRNGCTRFLIANLEIVNTLCSNAIYLDVVSNFQVTGCTIKDSGFPAMSDAACAPGALESWADGIAVSGCTNGWITGNTIENATDVGIVSGGGSCCHVEGNVISQSSGRSFAGIHVGSFYSGGRGCHARSVFSGNTISSTGGVIDAGIAVGHHRWTGALGTLWALYPEVRDNTVGGAPGMGATIGVMVDGLYHGLMEDNHVVSPGVAFPPPSCSACFDFPSRDFTAAHAEASCFRDDNQDSFASYAALCYHGGSSCGTSEPVASNNCTGAAFVSQSLPPFSMQTGETQTVRVKVRNTGTDTWNTGDLFMLASLSDAGCGTQLPCVGPADWGRNRVQLDPYEQVLPFQEKEFVFTITAPSQPGYYPFRWQMIKESAPLGTRRFGEDTWTAGTTFIRVLREGSTG